MSDGHDPDGLRLPVKFDAATIGEFAPIPLAPVRRRAKALALAAAGARARRLALARRRFLTSACGAACATSPCTRTCRSASVRIVSCTVSTNSPPRSAIWP